MGTGLDEGAREVGVGGKVKMDIAHERASEQVALADSCRRGAAEDEVR